jgi:beta-galactosidase/beta-glucuronidase
VPEPHAWQDIHSNQISRMWYQRPIRQPADWSGRAELFEFDRLSIYARLFVNDRECGDVHWLGAGGTVDITRAVTPGKKAFSGHAGRLVQLIDLGLRVRTRFLRILGLI